MRARFETGRRGGRGLLDLSSHRA